MAPAQTLLEKRILVVEDDYFLATNLQRDLIAVGAIVMGPAPSIQRAMAVIADGAAIDAAVLDINLGGEMAFPIADALRSRHVPFVFVTGYDADQITGRFASVPRYMKPLSFPELVDGLVTLWRTGAPGTTSRAP